MLIDTHAHLYWESFKEDFDQVIDRSIKAGVTTIINVGVDIELSKIALRQVQGKLANIPGLTAYSTIGIHPHEALRLASLASDKLFEEIEILEELYLNNPKIVVAVGECGLDYLFKDIDRHVANAPRNDNTIKSLQRKLFQAQIDLAKKLNLPLIVHCRDDRGSTGSPPTETLSPSAWDEVLEMIADQSAILHCYSGLEKTTQKVLKMPNTLISFAGTITYPGNEYLRDAAKVIPLNRMVLETDCPFLPPQSKRGQRNEPSSVLEIARLIADLKGVSWEEVAEQTTENAKKIFNI